jgi:hypothetical protein
MAVKDYILPFTRFSEQAVNNSLNRINLLAISNGKTRDEYIYVLDSIFQRVSFVSFGDINTGYVVPSFHLSYRPWESQIMPNPFLTEQYCRCSSMQSFNCITVANRIIFVGINTFVFHLLLRLKEIVHCLRYMCSSVYVFRFKKNQTTLMEFL